MQTSIESPLPPKPTRITPAGPKRKRLRWQLIVVLVMAGLFLLGGTGFVVVSSLEEHDTFCVSCHTAPEITYYNRAYYALDFPESGAPDLSTAHYLAYQTAAKPNFKCIDCHRGDGRLPHRITAVTLGVYDLGIFLLGQDDPTIEKQRTKTGWLADASCTACHTQTLLKLDGINNHFHSYLSQAQAALDHYGGTIEIGAALRAALGDSVRLRLSPVQVEIFCADCHQAHQAMPLGSTTFYMDSTLRNQACVACHLVVKQGPQDVRELAGN